MFEHNLSIDINYIFELQTDAFLRCVVQRLLVKSVHRKILNFWWPFTTNIPIQHSFTADSNKTKQKPSKSTV